MAILFGVNQFNKPTPASWSRGIQIYTVIASTLLAWIGTSNFIGASLSSVLQSILGLTIAISNALKPFLGVDTEKRTTVPIGEVTAMEAAEVKK